MSEYYYLCIFVIAGAIPRINLLFLFLKKLASY